MNSSSRDRIRLRAGALRGRSTQPRREAPRGSQDVPPRPARKSQCKCTTPPIYQLLSSPFFPSPYLFLSQCRSRAGNALLPFCAFLISRRSRLFHLSSLALSDTFALRSRQTKQLVFAVIAASIRSSILAAGTLATTSSRIAVTTQPVEKASDVTLAVVVIRSANSPMRSSSADRALEKDAA